MVQIPIALHYQLYQLEVYLEQLVVQPIPVLVHCRVDAQAIQAIRLLKLEVKQIVVVAVITQSKFLP